jgi:hypothetical protein
MRKGIFLKAVLNLLRSSIMWANLDEHEFEIVDNQFVKNGKS